MTYLAIIISAFCLANGLPHFVRGISGERFQSPFASPPGIGESGPVVNVLWGLFNFAACWALLALTGFFAIGMNTPTITFVSAFCLSAIILAVIFGRIRAKN